MRPKPPIERTRNHWARWDAFVYAPVPDARAEELTGVRLLVMHNLTYVESLVRGAREAIRLQRFGAYRDATLAGDPPWTPITAYAR